MKMKLIMPLMSHARILFIGLLLSLNTVMVEAAVVAVVSAESPLTTLSKDQVVNIFLGKTSNFPDGSRAVPIDQAEGSATRDAFYLKLSGKSPAQLKAHWSKIIFTGRGHPPPQVESSIEVKKRLIENPNAIGYIDQNQVDDSVKVLLLAP